MNYEMHLNGKKYVLGLSGTISGDYIPPTREYPGEDPEVEISIDTIKGEYDEYEINAEDHPDYKAVSDEFYDTSNNQHCAEAEDWFLSVNNA